MSDQPKPSILTVLQSILSALTGGAISGGGGSGTVNAATETTLAAASAKLTSINNKLPTISTQPTQALGITLNQGESTSWDNMLSLTLVNDDASTGDITIALESFATYLKPGESVSWDAAPSSVLSVVTITTPVGTTGRMFGIRYAPVVTGGA